LADILISETTRRFTGVGLMLDLFCKGMAVVSGITLTLMALMSMRSIVGRSFFDAPLVGDYELVQLLSAVAVAMALPYANWIGAHVIVDFFTAKAPRKANAFMDTVAQLLLALFAGVLTWRLFVGMLDLRSSFDASMLLDIPTWWAYAPMVPSFALLCATALYTAVDNLRKLLK
jgi:TRAP-type C4-dicarboxylate transport system permease small subunit